MDIDSDVIRTIYEKLLSLYGYQGWFPVLSLHTSGGNNPTKTGSMNGYHPKDYSYPKTELQKFEIAIGLVLTQNTNWVNVEKSLINLDKLNLLNPHELISADINLIKDCIKPSGYFNQKSQYLLNFTNFFLNLNGKFPSRDELLSVKGIGQETADGILLYAYKQPEFVIDAYTKRILYSLKFISEKEKYLSMKNLFEKSLEKDYKLYNEFHALLVEHAKHFYSKKPFGFDENNNIDPLLELI